MADMGVFRVSISALDDADVAQTILVEDGRGRTLSPTDTPANTWVYGGLLGVPAMRRDMFSGGAVGGNSRRSFGTLTFANPEGLWDHLSDWAFDGRTCTVYWSKDESLAFPGSWDLVQSMTMRRCSVTYDTVEIELRDGQEKLDQPIQTVLYDGDNVLPAGLEGVEDLEGKPKPLVFGSVRNLPLVEVNSAKLIYQASSEALNAVDGVYERGILLGGGAYWDDRTIPSLTTAFAGVAEAGGRWVAVGGQYIYTSDDDGENWIQRHTGADTLRDVIHVDSLGLWIAVGGATTSVVLTSPDAVTWTARTSGFGTDPVTRIAYASRIGGGVIVIGGAAGKVASSTNGTTYTLRTSALSDQIQSLASDGFRFVAFAVSGGVTVAQTSVDGTTWTTTGFQGLGDAFNVVDLQWGDGAWLGAATEIGTDFPALAVSRDGLAWSFRKQDFVGLLDSGSNTVSSVAYGNGSWVLCGTPGYIGATQDPEGAFTRQPTELTGSQLLRVRFGNDTFMAVGGSGGVSSDVLVATKPTTYASEADLLDDGLRPRAGTYKAYLTGGLVRIGSSPRGQVTADAVQGANAAARTVGQGAAWIWSRMGISAGTAAGDYLAADVTALDTAVNDVVGWWRGNETNATELLNLLALSARAWWGVDRLGRYRIERVVDPSGASADATFGGTGIPMAQDIRVLQAPLPIHRTRVRYSRNYQIQETDVVAGVSEARRELLRQPWLEVVDADAAVKTRHPLSEERELDTALTVRADAVTRAADEMALFDSQRRVLECSVDFDADTLALDLGDVINVLDTRLGLSAGVKGLVVHVDPDPTSERITFGLWMSA